MADKEMLMRALNAAEVKSEKNQFDMGVYTAWFDVVRQLGKDDLNLSLDWNKKLRGKLQAAGKLSRDARPYVDLIRKTYLYAAPYSFDDYCVYLEWNRESEKKFYLPRRSILLPVVNDLQSLIDDELDILAISLPPGSGKAQPLDAKVLTPTGFVAMGDIRVGDCVIDSDGKATKVIGVFPQGVKSVYRVSFNDGTSTECCADHLWYGQSRDDRCTNVYRDSQRYRVFDTKTMMQNVRVENGRRLNYSVDYVEPIDFDEKVLPLHPYVLGILLGDGSLISAPRFTNSEQSIVDKVARLVPQGDVSVKYSADRKNWSIRKDIASPNRHIRSVTHTALESFGLMGAGSEDKFIPEQYLLGSVEQRTELLRGLLDTDGYVGKSCIEYSTVSPRLRDGVVFLVRSLGGYATYKEKQGKYKKDGKTIYTKMSYRVIIQFSADGIVPVSSDKHLSKYGVKRSKIKKFVESIERVRKCECQCIMVDSPTHMYVTDDFICTHNTTLKIFLLSWLCGKYPDRPNLDSGHSGMMTQSTYDGVLGILNDNTEYLWRDVFPNAGAIITNAKELTIDVGKKHRFSTLTCRAIGASLTGATRCEGLLSADDLVSGIEEALSKDRLDKKWEAYNNDLKSRKKLGCKELHISTRWSVHDVIGRLERQYADSDRAKFVVVPALDENGESNFNYAHGVGFDTAFFEDMKASLDDASFRALYMNEPIEREGLLYHPDDLRRYYDLPDGDPDAVISICDTAEGGGDDTFLPVCAVYGNDHYCIDCVCSNALPEITDGLCAEVLLSTKANACQFESNSAGGRTADKVQDAVKSKDGHTHITKKRTTANKETKIIVNSPWVKEHVLFLDSKKIKKGSMYDKMIEKLCGYTVSGKNKHDDVPDGWAQYALFVQALSGNSVEVVKRPF